MKLLHTALGPIMTNCYFAVDDDNNTAIIDPAANPAKIIKIMRLILFLLSSKSSHPPKNKYKYTKSTLL